MAYVGIWRSFISHYDFSFEAIGLGDDKIEELAGKPIIYYITEVDGRITVKTKTIYGETEFTFQFGEQFEEDLPFGGKALSLVDHDRNEWLHEQTYQSVKGRDGEQLKIFIERKFEADGSTLFERIAVKGSALSVERVFDKMTEDQLKE